GEDRVRGGRGEHRAGHRGVEHADADVAGVQALVTAATAADEADLARDRAPGPGDEQQLGDAAGGDDGGVRLDGALHGLRDVVGGVVDQLLHGRLLCGL